MNGTFRAVPHPSEGDLLRYVDTELSELEERRLQVHLAQCGMCNERLESLARDARRAELYLSRLSPAAPDEVTRARTLAAVRRAAAARGQRPWWARGAARSVAAVAALLLVAIAAEPVRAWLSSGFRVLSGPGAVPAATPAMVPVAAPAAAIEHRSSVVAFQPGDAVFDLRIERPQTGGSLALEVHEAARASAQILGGGSETMMVLPSGLRVENQPGSVASYRVVVPATVEQVRVHIGDRLVATLHPGRQPAPWSEVFHLDPSR